MLYVNQSQFKLLAINILVRLFVKAYIRRLVFNELTYTQLLKTYTYTYTNSHTLFS